MRFLSFAAAGVFVAGALSTPALARSGGISGYSGKPMSIDGGQGPICTTCHTPGSPVPTVTLEGPRSVVPGSTNAYSLLITGGPAVRGGFNVSVDNAQATFVVAVGSGVKQLNGELTHDGAKTFTDGGVRFDFSLVAPTSGQGLTIYAAGNSADGARSAGDGVSALSAYVRLNSPGGDGGVPDGGSPDAGAPPSADAGAPPSPDAGAPPSPDAGDGSGQEPGHGGDMQGGCSSMGGGPVLSLVLGAVGLTLLRRRRA